MWRSREIEIDPEKKPKFKPASDFSVCDCIVLKGRPCQVLKVEPVPNAPGRLNITCQLLFEDRLMSSFIRRETVCEVPHVDLDSYEVVDISEAGDSITVISPSGVTRNDLPFPTPFKAINFAIMGAFRDGKVGTVCVASAMGVSHISGHMVTGIRTPRTQTPTDDMSKKTKKEAAQPQNDITFTHVRKGKSNKKMDPTRSFKNRTPLCDSGRAHPIKLSNHFDSLSTAHSH